MSTKLEDNITFLRRSTKLEDNITFLRRMIRELVAMNAAEYKATLVVDGAKWRVHMKVDRKPGPPRTKGKTRVKGMLRESQKSAARKK